MKKYIISLLIIFSTILVFPIYVFASVNSGFIPGQIWYSQETLTEGDTVNIHTAVWNGEKNSLSIKVGFYDKSVLLGNRDIVLAPLELKDVYISWKVTAGDHVISAKITSSTSTISGKSESVVLDHSITQSDKQTVSVAIKNDQGVSVSAGEDALQTQIDKTTREIDSIVPEQIRTPISNALTTIDSLRDKTSTEINTTKDETQKEVNAFKSESNIGQTTIQKTNIEDATKKPIAYIKLFLFSVLSFIFNNKIVFYSLLLIVAFYIIRFIFRLIRNK